MPSRKGWRTSTAGTACAQHNGSRGMPISKERNLILSWRRQAYLFQIADLLPMLCTRYWSGGWKNFQTRAGITPQKLGRLLQASDALKWVAGRMFNSSIQEICRACYK